MKHFKIYAGLGGGFGGASYLCTSEFRNIEEAIDFAYEQAAQEYESYDGLYGLRTVDDIMDEEDVDLEVAEEMYDEEMGSWLDYYVEEVK